MIARLREMLATKTDDPSFLGQVGQVAHAAGQRAEYALGIAPSDPIYKDLIPLTELLNVFLATPYMKGMRNMQWVNKIQAHLPKSTDSFSLLNDKLDNIESSLAGIEAGARESGQPAKKAADTGAIGANYDGVREQNGVRYHIKTDATGKVVLSEPVPVIKK